jgi:hypothetical protein
MTRQLVTIALTVACLIAVIVLQRRCGPAVETIFRALAPPVSDGGAAARDGF